MTDAAIPVTERAVERFAEAYLSVLGADVRKDGRRWTVSLPDDADTDLDLDGTTLVVTTDPAEVEDGAVALAPESEFVEGMLAEAADRWPVSALEFTGDALGVQLPRWLDEGPTRVVDRSFAPYYDRRALCVLFHVGIETVSEFQSETLRAIAIDLSSCERRPELEQTYLDLAETTDLSVAAGSVPDRGAVQDALDAAREAVKTDIEPTVEDVRERATRAAEVELEEYREYVRQRRVELDAEIDRLTERIEDATATAEAATGQDERVEALRERKELRAERDELQDERDDLRSEIEGGFPDRRRKVRDRHDLTVRVRPVSLAGISYERGSLDVSLRDGEETVDASFAYAVGVGVTDDPQCDRCGDRLTEANPLMIDNGCLTGTNCCR